MNASFIARATFCDGWWTAEIDVPGKLVFTEAKRPDRLEDMARDAVATALDTPADQVQVTVSVHLDDGLDAEIQQARSTSLRAADLIKEAGLLNRKVAQQLKSRGVSARDSGRLMGLSAQRISQLLS